MTTPYNLKAYSREQSDNKPARFPCLLLVQLLLSISQSVIGWILSWLKFVEFLLFQFQVYFDSCVTLLSPVVLNIHTFMVSLPYSSNRTGMLHSIVIGYCINYYLEVFRLLVGMTLFNRYTPIACCGK